MAQSAEPIDSLHKRFAEAGQGHVFRFWDQISQLERENLAQQAAGIDLESISGAYAALQGLPPRLQNLPVSIELANRLQQLIGQQ